MLQLNVIETLAGLDEIESEWTALEDTLSERTPFQTPVWLLSWWRHFGSGTLQTLAFREKDGSLAALVPAFQHLWEGRQQITLLGSGVSDYLEPAANPDRVEAVLSSLAAHLDANRHWETCKWQDLSADTWLSGLSSHHRLLVNVALDTPCSQIAIGEEFVQFWSKRPSGLRRNIRRYREKAEQAGHVETRVSTHLVDEYLQALIRLHTMRWREEGEPGMVSANRSARFLRDTAKTFSERGMLRIFTLHYQQEIVAVILAFAYRRGLYAYLSGFDPAHARLGFGSLLLHEALRYAFDQGYTVWNFLRGQESYKVEWGAVPVAKSRMIITRASSANA